MAEEILLIAIKYSYEQIKSTSTFFQFVQNSSSDYIILLTNKQNQLSMNEILENSYFANIRKEKYSFPKSQRFPQLKSKYTIDYYDQSSIKKQRTTSFGYGSKYDFFRESSRNKGPSPFQYSINSGRATRGQSFGLGRDNVKSNNYIDYEKFKIPNAGKYEVDSLNKIKKRAPSCVMISKHPEDSFIGKNENPDPAKYNPSDTIYSRRKRSAQFGFGSAKRFQYDNRHTNRMIGPNSYNLSPKNSATNIKMGRATRKTYAVEEIEKSISPGPKYFVQ